MEPLPSALGGACGPPLGRTPCEAPRRVGPGGFREERRGGLHAGGDAPWPGTFGYHEVFHAMTIVAAICHYIAVYFAVYNSPYL